MNEALIKEIKDSLSYDPYAGDFFWKKLGKGRGRKPDGRAGYTIFDKRKGKEYLVISIMKRRVLAHRAAFVLMTGRPPALLVDHRDGNGLNNAWSNLREATFPQNGQNSKRSERNKSGYKGVCFVAGKKKFRAAIRSNGKTVSLGYFDNALSAHWAYRMAAYEMFGEFAKVE